MGFISDLIRLNQLRKIQKKIYELSRKTTLPKIGHYSPDTIHIFPNGHKNACKYIQRVLDGNSDPLTLPIYGQKPRPFKDNYSSEWFWKIFAEYCSNMAEYCQDRESDIKELKELKEMEKELKMLLNID